MKYFSFDEFTNLSHLSALKKSKEITVGVCVPVLNERETILKTLTAIQACHSIIDDLVIIDSGSVDGSVEICKDLGVRVIADRDAAVDFNVPLTRGKGFNLWAGVCYLKNDVIAFVDSDIKNFSSRFLAGTIGPLVTDDDITFVKGYYHRPKGDARVTEILVRPFISQIFPELKAIVQPLSGEYAARRSFFNSINFYSGYSVEISILIDACLNLAPDEIGQVYLGHRFHKLQSVSSLGKMGASILRTLLEISNKDGRLIFTQDQLSDYLYSFTSIAPGNVDPNAVPIKDVLLMPTREVTSCP